MESSTQSLVMALRLLANDIQSEDGVPNAVVAEAAIRLERLTHQRDVALSVCSSLEQYGHSDGGSISKYFDTIKQFHQLKKEIQHER